MTWNDPRGHDHPRSSTVTPNPQPVWYPVQPVFSRPAPPRPRVASTVALAVGFTVIGVFALAVVVYFLIFLRPSLIAAGALLAFVPLAIVLVGIWLVDRWEPEPRVALLFAFLWGAAVAVSTALVVDIVVGNVRAVFGLADGDSADLFGAVVQAPVVEEAAKGFGVLLVLWIFRRHFDGPVDGIVYAATVAAGFAFVENIQYFAVQVADDLATGSQGLVFTFLVRAIMSPFAHVMYTACTGVALGYAVRRTGPFGAIGFFFAGLVPAIALHALWNGALVVVGGAFFAYYLLVQVPIFAAMVGLVIFLRRSERRTTHARLAEYAAVGWFSADEVAMLSTSAGRRRARRWAAANGLGPAMKRFVSDATRLASTRQRMLKGRRELDAVAGRDEAELLQALGASRAALQAPATAFADHAPRPDGTPWVDGSGRPMGSGYDGAGRGRQPVYYDQWGRPLPPQW
ncbi:PrsW family intramembrane metalloprotease [Frigoribacterium sp. CFBP9030]|uniref:PrsW family intramembrane metalloprotease n=1 Tax=Frigoribacterium sp. CFBP9030 TaxID=3096537 RepID=UPI002A6B7274|nr:PrsW family intramembrane metalloprotease [Frigoribacterium sp. CFBP9030]MDY0890703.1 PrsW family intramembrane metalloprotease [Frigoribacterium sp. CFBP9030]